MCAYAHLRAVRIQWNQALVNSFVKINDTLSIARVMKISPTAPRESQSK